MELCPIIASIVSNQSEINETSEKLKHMAKSFNDILIPALECYSKNAKEYILIRDENNVKLFSLLSNVIKQLENVFSMYDLIVRPMSSICAKLNLINESDIDVGILVKNLNIDSENLDIKLFESIKVLLEQNGFIFDHIFNENVPSNRYYSFVKYVDDVEIEVKVRDYDTSLIILQLHEKLNNNFTEKEIQLLTYAKYLMKQHSDKTAYQNLKKIIYESVFSQIEGGFLL